jgi:Tripartite tricarboxylate transporter family receptor
MALSAVARGVCGPPLRRNGAGNEQFRIVTLRARLHAAAIVMLCLASQSAVAQDFPNREVHFICAIAPGSGADIIVRYIAEKMRVLMQRPVIVENKPGASGNIATEYAARAKPDGYLANALPAERGAKLKERVVAYAKAAAKYEWPAMAHHADTDDPVFKSLDGVLAGLTIELSREIAQGDTSPITPMVLPQIFEARSARLARLALGHSSISEAQWFALVALMVSVQVSIALVYNHSPRHQFLAANVISLAGGVAFYVLLAHDRPFTGSITVSPKPLQRLEMEAYRGAEIPLAIPAAVPSKPEPP